MPNHYTLFSFEIDQLTPDERAWVAAEIRDSDHMENTYGEEMDPGFVVKVQDRPHPAAWIYADEGTPGTPEYAANFVHAFLEKFRPDKSIGFEWANTCNRPVLDSFGGGACFVTVDEVRWMVSGDWLAEQTTGQP